MGGLPAGAAIFRSAPGALLKGPRPALRAAGSRFGSVLAPGPRFGRTGGCGSSGHHRRGLSVLGQHWAGAVRVWAEASFQGRPDTIGDPRRY